MNTRQPFPHKQPKVTHDVDTLNPASSRKYSIGADSEMILQPRQIQNAMNRKRSFLKSKSDVICHHK